MIQDKIHDKILFSRLTLGSPIESTQVSLKRRHYSAKPTFDLHRSKATDGTEKRATKEKDEFTKKEIKSTDFDEPIVDTSEIGTHSFVSFGLFLLSSSESISFLLQCSMQTIIAWRRKNPMPRKCHSDKCSYRMGRQRLNFATVTTSTIRSSP